jgi:hypothetical protein
MAAMKKRELLKSHPFTLDDIEPKLYNEEGRVISNEGHPSSA